MEMLSQADGGRRWGRVERMSRLPDIISCLCYRLLNFLPENHTQTRTPKNHSTRAAKYLPLCKRVRSVLQPQVIFPQAALAQQHHVFCLYVFTGKQVVHRVTGRSFRLTHWLFVQRRTAQTQTHLWCLWPVRAHGVCMLGSTSGLAKVHSVAAHSKAHTGERILTSLQYYFACSG